jgi:hypothetical protein
MIAIITSTIFPAAATASTGYRSSIDYRDRLMQTIKTIQSLVNLQFSEIYLFDNSGFNWDESVTPQLLPAKIIKFNMFQFDNKGLSELYMLLHGLSIIPADTPLLKISGRYILEQKVADTLLKEVDFAGKFHPDTISTRAYYFSSKAIMQNVLYLAVNNMYSYKHKIVGFRSLFKVLQNAFFDNGQTSFYDTTISIERGMFNAIKKLKLKTQHLPVIHVSGVSGHADDHQKIIRE